MKLTARPKFPLLLALLVPMLYSTEALAADTFEETLTAPGAITLDVSTGSGSIDVTSGPGREITVIGTVKIQKKGWLFRRAPANADEIIQAVQDSGMVGLGGAAFPTHVKMKPPPEHTVDTLVVNGCECEPYLTCDHRLMLEQTDNLLAGIGIALVIA